MSNRGGSRNGLRGSNREVGESTKDESEKEDLGVHFQRERVGSFTRRGGSRNGRGIGSRRVVLSNLCTNLTRSTVALTTVPNCLGPNTDSCLECAVPTGWAAGFFTYRVNQPCATAAPSGVVSPNFHNKAYNFCIKIPTSSFTTATGNRQGGKSANACRVTCTWTG